MKELQHADLVVQLTHSPFHEKYVHIIWGLWMSIIKLYVIFYQEVEVN